MRIHSIHAGHCRNFYDSVSNGKIIIKEWNEETTYVVEDNRISSFTALRKNNKEKDVWAYGKYHKKYKNNVCILHERFKRGSTTARIFSGVWQTGYDKLCDYDVKYDRLCYGGSFRREIVKYKGTKKIAYTTSLNKKITEVFYPNGKLWAKFIGKMKFAYSKTVLLNEKFKMAVETGADFSKIFTSNNYSVQIFDKKGMLSTAGAVENRQHIGEWTVNYNKTYYLQGVAVSERIYKSNGEDLDPAEVLQIANVQLRSALLSKIGLETVIKKVNGSIIDKDEVNGYELISIPLVQEKTTWGMRGDSELCLLKVKCPSTNVFYTLRVSPEMKTCEQARQWTFGVNNPKITKDAEEGNQYIELEKEV